MPSGGQGKPQHRSRRASVSRCRYVRTEPGRSTPFGREILCGNHPRTRPLRPCASLVGQPTLRAPTADPGAVVFADDAGAERAQSLPTNHRGPWLWCARAAEVRGGATGRRRGHRSRCRPFRTRGSESRSSPCSGPRRHDRWRTTGIDCRRSRSTVDSSCSRHETRLCGGRRGPMMSAITWVVLAVRTKARSSVRKRWAPASARAPRVSAVNRQRTPRGLGRDRGPRRP
jgi:hypothetical protein